MKKSARLLCLIFCIILTAAVLVACGEPPHEHTWDNGTTTKEPTCSEKGTLLFRCSGCDETKTEELDMVAHTEIDVSVQLPTCTEPGLTAGKICGVCEAVIVAQEPMPKLGHELVDNVCVRCSYEYYTDGLIFESSGGGNNYTVVGYEGTEAEVVIPSKYYNMPVVAIAAEAFKGNETIKAVSIPDSITSIGESAFYECDELEQITIPTGVTVINASTFYKCKSLESVTFAGSIESIGASAFEFCQSLGSVSIPDSCLSIGESAFTCCYELYSVTLPVGLTHLGANAFSWCESLGTVTVPASVTTISAHAFFHCTALTSVTISEGVQVIEAYAFQTCPELKSIHIPASVTKVESYAFAYSDYIESVTVAENNTTYDSRDLCNAIIETATGTMVFGCFKTRIPEGVTAIGEAAFFGNTNLSFINIPETVVSIGKSAFSGCESLSSIVIPSGVTEIADGLLAGCENLTTIDIRGNVTSIGAGAFKATIRLEKIILPASITVIGENAFTNASTNAVIYFRGTSDQWEAIDGHDAADVSNYQLNGKLIFAYTGD